MLHSAAALSLRSCHRSRTKMPGMSRVAAEVSFKSFNDFIGKKIPAHLAWWISRECAPIPQQQPSLNGHLTEELREEGLSRPNETQQFHGFSCLRIAAFEWLPRSYRRILWPC